MAQPEEYGNLESRFALSKLKTQNSYRESKKQWSWRGINLQDKLRRPVAIYGVLAWILINAVFMILELTFFNDAADLNNSILLILWVSSAVGLLLMKKWGAAVVTFSLVYAFSFNAFNVIYFPSTSLLNGASSIVNAVAIVYMFRSIFANRFQ